MRARAQRVSTPRASIAPRTGKTRIRCAWIITRRRVAAISAASETLAANWTKNTFLPFHPGAARYYREAGVAIAPALLP